MHDDSSHATIAGWNPFKYRGYYYDTELGLYYLQTRYYDSNTGRFINADGYVTTGQGLISYNMYAYCCNNPITYVDYSGEFFGIPITIGLTWGLVFLGGMALAYDITHDQVLSKVAIGLVSDVCDAVSSVASAIKSIFFSKAEEKEEVTTVPPKNQAYFTESPYAFNPSGLIRKEFPGTKNGKIIKWFDPNTKKAIFEWDEDLEYGPHYHILIDGKHVGDHIKPKTPVPEPYNTIYFGG